MTQAQQVLSKAQVGQALAVLREERRSHPYTAAQRRLYNWFRISFWGFWLSYVALIVALMWRGANTGDVPEPVGGLIALLALMSLSLLSLVVSVPAQWPLFWRTLREYRLARRMRVLHLAAPGGPWAAVARLARWTALLILAAGVVGAAALIPRNPVAGSGALLLALTVPFYWFVAHARKRLAALDALEPLLERSETAMSEAGGVVLPAVVVQQIGDVEDEQIQRRRVEAISKGASAPSGYALLRSRALIAEEARLDPAMQLQIEARMADLAANPQPADAQPAGPGVWRVPAAGMEILYAVDHDAHRIELHELRSGLEESAGGGAASIEYA